jgi:hypothetical protein
MIRFDVDNETADRLPNSALDALLVGVSPLPWLFNLSTLRVTGSASAKSTASISAGSSRRVVPVGHARVFYVRRADRAIQRSEGSAPS